MEKREIITLKKQIPFIEQCMEKFGYIVTNVKKVGQNWTISLERENSPSIQEAFCQKQTEEKLRLIEITYRKKCGFNELFLNLMAHIILFCIQGAILYRLNLTNAHPKIMLEIGVLLFLTFLGASFAFKLLELLRWDRLIKKLKKEIILGETIVEQNENSDFKVISVLFTRNHGLVSDLIYWASGRQYTHASLGLGEQTEEFFSFDYRGFRKEHPGHRKTNNNIKNSLCYQFKVTSEEYKRIEKVIFDYLEIQPQFKYNLLGAILSVFHIYMPLKSSKVYFCSEFVSQQLRTMSSFKLKKQANMYLPTNLSKALIQQKNLYKILVNEI